MRLLSSHISILTVRLRCDSPSFSCVSSYTSHLTFFDRSLFLLILFTSHTVSLCVKKVCHTLTVSWSVRLVLKSECLDIIYTQRNLVFQAPLNNAVVIL